MTNNLPLNDQRNKEPSEGSILLRDYIQKVEPTDNLPQDNLHPILMGLFGEVGSVMAAAKKHCREGKAYVEYQHALKKEFGDVLWYFTALCRRLEVGLDTIFSEVIDQDGYIKATAASDLLDGPVSVVSSIDTLPTLDQTLLNLGEATAALLGIESMDDQTHDLLRAFLSCYLQALQAAHVNFSKVVRMNMRKTCGRFLDPCLSTLPTFDSDFPNEERLPQHFEIKIVQQKNGQSYLQWNGVFIGEPLTDNALESDGYRFHDVFHFAHAAILHWSPIFRALIKQKRKSNPQFDEVQDGGRAIVIEEGLTAWIFSCAKHLNFFDGQDSVSFGLLKVVQQFVRGYEVESCPLKLWEQAILEGYKVFRQVRANNGGIVVGDRETRAITYRPIEG